MTVIGPIPAVPSPGAELAPWAMRSTASANALIRYINRPRTQRIPGNALNVMAPPYNTAADGATNDATAISQAITDCDAAGGGMVYLPAGTYAIAGQIANSVTNKVVLRGDGKGATILLATASAGGLKLTYSSQFKAPEVRGISFLSGVAGATQALQYIGPSLASASTVGPITENVEFRGSDTSVDYWAAGLLYTNVWYPILRDFTFKGKDETALPFSMATGVVYATTETPFIGDGTFYHMEDCVLQSGASFGEGLAVGGRVEMVGVRRGIKTSGTVAIKGANFLHINSYERGITLSGTVQVAICGCSFYKNSLSTSSYIGLELASGQQDMTVTGNHFEDNPSATGGYVGILMSGTGSGNVIVGNTFDYLASAGAVIVLGTGTTDSIVAANTGGTNGAAMTTVQINSDAGANNLIFGNRTRSGTTAVVNNSTVNQWIFNNYPLPAQSLAANSTTPSVQSQQHGFWRTQNTLSTTITNLPGGTLGQRVTVQINDLNTGWTNNPAVLFLNGGANIPVGTGAGHCISFINDGSRWIEESRSF